MPVQKQKIIIPSDKEIVKIEIIEVKEKELDGTFNIYPAQEPYIPDYGTPPFIQPKKAIYDKNEYYPKDIIISTGTGYMAGNHLCYLDIYPIQYNPVTKKLKIFSYIKFRLEYGTSKEEFKTSKVLSKSSYDYLTNHIKKIVLNPNEVKQYSTLNYIEDIKDIQLKSAPVDPEILGIDYIIITNEELAPGFQEISDWKIKKGLPTKIITTEWISQNFSGSDIPERIRNFIQYAFQNWGTIWFIIGGDTNVVPIRYAWISHFNHWQLLNIRPYGEFIPTDMYYACLDGNWNADGDATFGEANWDRENNGSFQQSGSNIDIVDRTYDVFVGRIPIKNINQLTNYKEKYFEYINKNSSGNENNILLFSANSDGIYCSLMNTVGNCFPSYTFIKKLYECAGSNTTNCGTKQDVLNELNAVNGTNYHIICGYGHGGNKGFEACDASILSHEIDNLQNTDKSEILYNNHCNTMMWDKDCIGEHFINSSNGGVVYIGNTRFGWTGDPTKYNDNFISNIYNNGLVNIGEAFFEAKGIGSSVDGTSRWGFFALNISSDPEMPVWTNTPQILNVSVSPTTIVSGENTIVVTINNLPSGKTATICLQKGDEGYATQTVTSNGSYNFTFTPHTSGQINVTVTAHNFKPYESTITVNTNQNQNIFISNLTFDDDKTGNSNGNNDHQIDAGETIELTIELKNNGALGATNVSATLTSISPYVSISNNNSSYGNISSGGTKSSLAKYIFTIDKDAPEILVNDLNPVKFILQITDGASNSYTDVFNIDVFKPEIEQANKTIVTTNDGDKIIEPNESVNINIDLFNKDKAQATGITGVLSGNSSYITSCSATPRNYPAIDKFGTETNTSVYQFTVSPSYTVGQTLDFFLQVENEYGKTWLFNFNLLDKPAKINTSTIDFSADNTEIELFWTPYTNISGYNIYRSDADANGNEVGNYVKLNTFVVPAAFYNDFGLNELTKYYYKISVVSLTGNESELSDAFLAWTSYPSKGLFPVQMDVGNSIVSSINVADINNDNLKEIFTNISIDSKNSYLIGLNSDGTELFDIDGNVTTYSGFAYLNAAMNSTPAIGDLESNGQYKVISMTRDVSADRTNYFSCHSVKDDNSDGKPDLIWQHTISHPCYRTPIISNLDNSADGSLESVFYTEWGGIRIYNATGQLLYSFADGIGGTYGSLSVADIDGNGDKEIIGCYANSTTNGIYIWHHNGSNYGSSQPYYTLSGYNFCSSSIICDLDNDGDKEILTAALKSGGSEGRIVAIHHNGTVVSGWNDTQKLSYPNDWHSQDISVGDLNNDGNLEVVAIGTNVVKVWSKSGTQISSTTVSNLNPGKLTPILADVDNDADIEIIFGSNNEGLIHALNMDGSKVLGFPLHVDDALQGSPCVADVDNNGKSELIAGSGNKIYMWETNGNSQLIEWGSERHDPHNTGEYYEICPPTIITSNTTWSTNKNLCGDIIINSGTLTIASTCTVTMADYTRILNNSGGELKVDAGKIMNASIKALSGSNIILKNNGYIKISDHGEFNINTGATFDYQYGTLDITQ